MDGPKRIKFVDVAKRNLWMFLKESNLWMFLKELIDIFTNI